MKAKTIFYFGKDFENYTKQREALQGKEIFGSYLTSGKTIFVIPDDSLCWDGTDKYVYGLVHPNQIKPREMKNCLDMGFLGTLHGRVKFRIDSPTHITFKYNHGSYQNEKKCKIITEKTRNVESVTFYFLDCQPFFIPDQ